MAKLDLYLRSMVRFGARAVLLKSGANVTLRFPSGDRHATQTTPHGQLQQMVGAAAPDAARAEIVAGKATTFDYVFEGQNYKVSVQPTGSAWSVEVESVPTSGGGASSGGGAASEGLEIERTAYEATPDPDATSALPIERNQHAMPATGLAAASIAKSREVPASGLAAASRAVDTAASAPSLSVAGPAPQAAPKATPPSVSPSVSTSTSTSAPIKRDGGAWIDKLLFRCKEVGASDLHLCCGSPPYVRESGEMATWDDMEVFTPENLLRYLYEITPAGNREEFESRNDTDFAYAVEGLSRFRVNMFRDRKGPGAVLRAIPFEIPSVKDLGIPEPCLELCKLTKGLVLVTGPTGSGKSTTLAALIDYINKTRGEHLITIEDPIEFVHDNQRCLVNQREIGTHTNSFKDALRAALREDPDIVLVGEMRDLETIAIAVETAETGHLVFGTLHTSTAPGTVDRIIDQFPADQQEQIRTMLAESLKGVIAQVLCRRKPKGRVAAHEILIGTSAVANLIREKKTFQLFSVMQTGRKLGMQTLNDSLIDLVKRGVVDPNEAYMKSVNKAEFKNLLGRAGITLS